VVSSTPRPHFTPGKDPVPILQEAGWAAGPVWTGGKSHPHRDSIPDRPARSQPLYRQSYPVHPKVKKLDLNLVTNTWEQQDMQQRGALRKHSYSLKEVLRIMSLCFMAWLVGMQCACAVLYCHLWPAWLHRIFPHYLTNT